MDKGAPFSPFKPKILRTLLLLDVPSSLTTKLILPYPKSESPNSFRSPALPLIMDHIFEKKDNSFYVDLFPSSLLSGGTARPSPTLF